MKVFDCFVPDPEDYASVLLQLKQAQTELQMCRALGETLREEIASRDRRYFELLAHLKQQHLEVIRSLTQGDEGSNVIKENEDAQTQSLPA